MERNNTDKWASVEKRHHDAGMTLPGMNGESAPFMEMNGISPMGSENGRLTRFLRTQAQIAEYRLMKKAYQQRLRHLVDAQIIYDKAKIKKELSKSLAVFQAELVRFAGENGLQLVQEQRRVADEINIEIAAFIEDTMEADMPEIMRERQLDRIMGQWEWWHVRLFSLEY